jgi:hypothetical protein
MSTPLFQEFSPEEITWQSEARQFIKHFNYSSGVLELFYSGGVGSAKTIHHVHEIVKNCLHQPNSRWLMVRRTLKDLKRTSWAELLRHMGDIPQVIKSYNRSELKITFHNGSEILGDSYDDGDLTKFQSLNLSGLDIEEANEMPSRDIYEGLKLRIGRAGVNRNMIFCRSNPDEPDHWLYKYFINDQEHPNKKVFYSLTEQNPFLPPWYLQNLKRDLSPLMARRKLYGEWISILGEGIYYNYSSARNFKQGEAYKFNPSYPIAICHDFNIGEGKPMSAAVGQRINGVFHVAKTYLMDGLRTLQILEEIAEDKIFEHPTTFYFYGDASGRANDTRSNQSDWDIIEDFVSNYKRKNGTSLEFSIDVPRSNPPIRRRHNRLNALFMNDLKEVRLYVYKGAADADEGFRLTKLKKGSRLQEDDSFRCQHVTTAIGYWCDYILEYENESSTIKLF